MTDNLRVDMFSDVDYEKMTGLITKDKYYVAQILIEEGIEKAKIAIFVEPEQTVEFDFYEFQKILNDTLERLKNYV